MKRLFLDLETTGTDPRRHGIIQIAGILELEGRVTREFDYSVRPFDDDHVEDEALRVTGKGRHSIMASADPRATYRALVAQLESAVGRYDKTDKLFLVGYNVNFDADFLRQFFLKNGDKYYGSYFWWPSIDVAVLAAEHLASERHLLPDFKLATVRDRLGIHVEGDAHDALHDVRVTREIYRLVSRDTLSVCGTSVSSPAASCSLPA